MLERWTKNKYFGDSYLLAGRFWVNLSAQISCLTGRAGQSALETATPSNLGYNRGTHFCRTKSQGCKKSTRIKMLVVNMFGDKTLSIIQTNFIIKDVNDEKCP